MKEIVLANRENCRKVSDNLLYMWMREVLYLTGMDIEGCFPEDSDDPEDQTLDQKAMLRKALQDNDIFVLKGEDTKIYIQKTLIGEWKNPKFVLKQDLSQINPRKKFYVEIELDYWSVFDLEEE